MPLVPEQKSRCSPWSTAAFLQEKQPLTFAVNRCRYSTKEHDNDEQSPERPTSLEIAGRP